MGVYIAIDLKSFYASVECVDRGLDPLNTNLVVADESRTEKTICLAVTPSLKAYGIPGRARLFEVIQKAEEVNRVRLRRVGTFTGESYLADALNRDPGLKLSFLTAPPRMAKYMEISTKVFNIYMRYIAPEDIHVYSIDEVMMDVTNYLQTYHMTARELAKTMILDVLHTTGITATAGIGTNLYLCKVAMDIMAKHVAPDEDGVRIAELDEMSYRRQLWEHRPLTDFWRVGPGYARKLAQAGLYTMGDVARCSIGKAGDYYNEDLLYKLFGVNAELLIDHAWGWEPCTIAQIKSYRPSTNSLGSGQVLSCPYDWEKARLVVKEMTDLLVLELVDKGLVTDQMVLTVGYDVDNLRQDQKEKYRGEVTTDRYGRKIPKHAHGTGNIGRKTSSTHLIMEAVLSLYDDIVNPKLMIRRINITANHVIPEADAEQETQFEQLSLFEDVEQEELRRQQEERDLAREKRMQHAVIDIKKKFGKNAILKGMNLEEGATARNRNNQIGGHRA